VAARVPGPTSRVRPLALGTVGQIAEAMRWSVPYTIGVLTYWKMAPVYCQAVLSHDQRITLDGAPAEPVDAEAKELAAKQLAKLATRNAAKKPAPAKAKPKTKPVSAPETPTQLRARVRAGLLRRR
jgi:sRNA-binding protein